MAANTPTSVAPAVAQVVASLGPVEQIADDDLADELGQCERAVQVLMARQAELMAEMGRRAESADRQVQQRLGRTLWSGEGRAEFVADEVAVTLTCTHALATRRYRLAKAAARFPALMSSWRHGTIDERRVAVIAEGLVDVDPAFADQLAEAAIEYGTTHTPPQLRTWLARRVLASDPSAAEIRRRRSLDNRHVVLTPLADGLSELTALLPSVQARQIYDTVTAIAQAAEARDLRTMDQRRADALIDLLVGRAEPPQVTLSVLVPVDTMLGDGDYPGDIAGIGPMSGAFTRQLASQALGCASVREIRFDDATGVHLPDEGLGPASGYRPSPAIAGFVRHRDVTCRFPGCRRSALTAASGTDLDHVTAWPEGPTAVDNLVVLCRHHHRVKHSPGWNVELDEHDLLHWTTPSGKHFTTEPWAYRDPPPV